MFKAFRRKNDFDWSVYFAILYNSKVHLITTRDGVTSDPNVRVS